MQGIRKTRGPGTRSTFLLENYLFTINRYVPDGQILAKLLICSLSTGQIPLLDYLPSFLEEFLQQNFMFLLWICTSIFLCVWFPLTSPFRYLATCIWFLWREPSKCNVFSPSPSKQPGSTRDCRKNGPNYFLIRDIHSVIFDTFNLFAIPWIYVFQHHNTFPPEGIPVAFFIVGMIACWHIAYLCRGYFRILWIKYVEVGLYWGQLVSYSAQN